MINSTHEDIGFFVSGLFNNASYVIMLAGAKNITPSAVGLVYVCNIFPSFLVSFQCVSSSICLLYCPSTGETDWAILVSFMSLSLQIYSSICIDGYIIYCRFYWQLRECLVDAAFGSHLLLATEWIRRSICVGIQFSL